MGPYLLGHGTGPGAVAPIVPPFEPALMVVDDVLEGLDQKKEDMRTIFDQIQEKASSALELSLKWEEIDEQFGFLKQRTLEAELKEASVRKQTLELEKKEKTFLLKQQTEAREIELKSKVLDLKEKELEEREKEIQLKQREMEEGAIQAETRKRSRFESESSLFAERGTDADQTLTRPGKKHKPITQDKEKDSAFVVSDSTSSPLHISEAHEGDIEEAVSIDDNDEDHEPLKCVNSGFNDFTKTISSFVVGQVWALYDPIDKMPRYYAQIKGILKHQLSLRVKWLEPVGTSENKKPNPACGRFKYGKSGTSEKLMFSHEMSYTIRFGKIVSINPRKGEIWALFRDWTKTWNVHREQHKTPYRYDFVEVLSEFDKNQGIGVAYLGKVEGFVSVFKQAGQHGVVALMITPEEMRRFSHRVPSFRLNGEEKEGVPAGSFELDPAALPSSTLNRKTGEVEDQDGSRTDCPNIILD